MTMMLLCGWQWGGGLAEGWGADRGVMVTGISQSWSYQPSPQGPSPQGPYQPWALAYLG